MEEFTDLISGTSEMVDLGASENLFLVYAKREKARLKVKLDSGEEIGIRLKRGLVMRGGDFLRSKSGRLLTVVSAKENLSVVNSESSMNLARVAYHLGNRHVDVQIVVNALFYLSDDVLDDMVRGLGFDITFKQGPFEPESGAYVNRSHGH